MRTCRLENQQFCCRPREGTNKLPMVKRKGKDIQMEDGFRGQGSGVLQSFGSSSAQKLTISNLE